MRRICMHHFDADGYCAAAVVLRKFPDAVCVPVGYTKTFPIEHITSPTDQVIIVDYSFSNVEELKAILSKISSLSENSSNVEELKTILSKTSNLIWIDHHLTSSNLVEYKDIPGLRVQREPAACLLCWQYFFPKEPVPLAVSLVSDYDTWKFSYGDITRLFTRGLSSQATPTSPIWKDLFGPLGDISVNKLVEEGKIILRYENYVNSIILEKTSFETVFHGHSAVVCNSMWGNMDIFKGGPEKDIYIKMYFNGELWTVTLYSKVVDCEKLAKKYGGGGHKGSAGFSCSAFPFWETNPLNKDVLNQTVATKIS